MSVFFQCKEAQETPTHISLFTCSGKFCGHCLPLLQLYRPDEPNRNFAICRKACRKRSLFGRCHMDAEECLALPTVRLTSGESVHETCASCASRRKRGFRNVFLVFWTPKHLHTASTSRTQYSRARQVVSASGIHAGAPKRICTCFRLLTRLSPTTALAAQLHPCSRVHTIPPAVYVPPCIISMSSMIRGHGLRLRKLEASSCEPAVECCEPVSARLSGTVFLGTDLQTCQEGNSFEHRAVILVDWF